MHQRFFFNFWLFLEPSILVHSTEEEESKNAIVIMVDYSEKLPWDKIVQLLKEKGTIKTLSFKEGQTFGFAQFVDFKVFSHFFSHRSNERNSCSFFELRE